MIFTTTTNVRVDTSIRGWAADLTDEEYDQVASALEHGEIGYCKLNCLCEACIADDLEQSDLVQSRVLAREGGGG